MAKGKEPGKAVARKGKKFWQTENFQGYMFMISISRDNS